MTTLNSRRISWQVSFALDVLRLLAAFVVFFHHGYGMWFNNSFTKDLAYAAHFSVIIFFVLSGYLIAYTTTNNNRGAIQYAQARLSRLYSVLLPAILITAICQSIVYYVNPVLYSQYTRPHIVLRYILSSLFINEVWFFSAAPSINGPLWSMSYEFWYYVIFGLWFYVTKPGISFIWLLVAILIAGPSILSLMPVWLMGCLAYKLSHLKTSNRMSWPIFYLSLIAAVVLMKIMPALPFALGQPPLYYANQFIKDDVLGLFLAAALYAITQVESVKKQPPLGKAVRQIADLTFPLYLLHFPLLVLWQGVFPKRQGDIMQFTLAMVGVLATTTVAGILLESKRNWWGNLFGYLLKLLNVDRLKIKAQFPTRKTN